jgi:cytochrome P450
MVEFHPYSPEYAANPYPIYKALRDEAPVYYCKPLNFYALSRYADVVEAHRDYQTYSSAGGVTIEGHEALGGNLLIVKDVPEHRWHKALVTKVFTRDRMGALEPFVRNLAIKLIEENGKKDSFDFVNDLAVKIPLEVISEMIGIPEELRPDIHHLSNKSVLRGEGVDMAQVFQAAMQLNQIYLGLVKDRRANPRDDVITMLINAEVEDDEGAVRQMTDEELAVRFGELAFAGHETVAKAIPNGAMAMQRFRDQRQILIDDPSKIHNAVEEILRFDPPSQLQGRTTTCDVTLHGVTIPAGTKTMLLTGSATRDERRFENPETFDVTRENDMISVYFGYGIHRCLGIHLARVEIRVAFEELLSRYPDYEVQIENSTRSVLTNVRGVSTLPARMGAHA